MQKLRGVVHRLVLEERGAQQRTKPQCFAPLRMNATSPLPRLFSELFSSSLPAMVATSFALRLSLKEGDVKRESLVTSTLAFLWTPLTLMSASCSLSVSLHTRKRLSVVCLNRGGKEDKKLSCDTVYVAVRDVDAKILRHHRGDSTRTRPTAGIRSPLFSPLLDVTSFSMRAAGWRWCFKSNVESKVSLAPMYLFRQPKLDQASFACSGECAWCVCVDGWGCVCTCV